MNELFAERLKELRAEQGVSQVLLAKSLGVSKGIVSLWENKEKGRACCLRLHAL